MTFEPAAAPVPTSVGPLRMNIVIPETLGDTTMQFAFTILDQDGQPMDRRGGDAIPHLTPTEVSQLTAMVQRWRGLAEGTLPQP